MRWAEETRTVDRLRVGGWPRWSSENGDGGAGAGAGGCEVSDWYVAGGRSGVTEGEEGRRVERRTTSSRLERQALLLLYYVSSPGSLRSTSFAKRDRESLLVGFISISSSRALRLQLDRLPDRPPRSMSSTLVHIRRPLQLGMELVPRLPVLVDRTGQNDLLLLRRCLYLSVR